MDPEVVALVERENTGIHEGKMRPTKEALTDREAGALAGVRRLVALLDVQVWLITNMTEAPVIDDVAELIVYVKEARLVEYYERYADSDIDGDGVLSVEEFEAYRAGLADMKKMRLPERYIKERPTDTDR